MGPPAAGQHAQERPGPVSATGNGRKIKAISAV
jgi:hypothetical protein